MRVASQLVGYIVDILGICAWITRPERLKVTKDEVKWTFKSGPGGPLDFQLPLYFASPLLSRNQIKFDWLHTGNCVVFQ